MYTETALTDALPILSRPFKGNADHWIYFPLVSGKKRLHFFNAWFYSFFSFIMKEKASLHPLSHRAELLLKNWWFTAEGEAAGAGQKMTQAEGKLAGSGWWVRCHHGALRVCPALPRAGRCGPAGMARWRLLSPGPAAGSRQACGPSRSSLAASEGWCSSGFAASAGGWKLTPFPKVLTDYLELNSALRFCRQKREELSPPGCFH